MRKAMRLAFCAVVLGLGANVASADVLTIAITGQVVSANDSSLGVTVGQAVSGTYSYDTSTPVGSNNTYTLASPPANITLSVAGGPTYQTQNNWSFQIAVDPPNLPGQNIFSYTATSPSSGGASTTFNVGFEDPSAQWLTSTALPTTLPPLGSNRQVSGAILIQPANSSGFWAQINTVAVVPSITVSPANSSFITQQNFDAALLLSAQLPVSSMQASVNGTSIGFSYPGTCSLAPANNAQRTALICPNAAAVLATLGGGPVTINWQVVLGDGSVLQQSVIWNLVL